MHAPSPEAGAARSSALPLALLLAVLLTAGWTLIGWGDLTRLILPDTDDAMRLVQIRDWLDGQAFADLRQSRLVGEADGLAMHWSRLPDLVPGIVMRLLTPFMGQPRAELAAVIFWPELLFFLHLLLAGALARRLSAPAVVPIAVLLAALAYPAIGLFIPGRIDHHGLQIVLVQAMLLGLVSDRLFAAGLAAAASLLVGLETAPALLAAMLALFWLWVEGGKRVLGFGLGLLAGTLAGFALLRPLQWNAGWCDSFTPGLFALMLIASGGWLLLAGLHPRLPDARWRFGAGVGVAILAIACGWAAAPDCFRSPYGPVDPLLARIWLGAVGEAGGLFRQPPPIVIAYLGLPLVALAVAIHTWRREPERRASWLFPLALLIASLLTSLAQVRGIWFGAAIAAPLLAHWVARARQQGLGRLAIAWLASAGLVWQAAGSAVARFAPASRDATTAVVGRCEDQRLFGQLDRLPTGTVVAPIDIGPYILSQTDHRVLAAPYHRNNRGNRAMYDFFLATPDGARYQAGLWTIDYVVLCPGSFAELPPGMIKSNSLVAHLRMGVAPEWLEPILSLEGGPQAWRVRGVALP